MQPPGSSVVPRERLLRQARARLEEQLRVGEAVRAEQLLAEYPALAEEEDAALELISDEFFLRRELGQRPDPEEWFARFPQYSGRLRKTFEVLLALDAEAPLSDGATPPVVSSAGTPTLTLTPRPDRYELREEIGRGGMGVVYRAWQGDLHRFVALKMVLAGRHADAAELRRFHIEARSAAGLHHPNIVQVHEVGERDGCPYLAMELVEGGTLAGRLAGKPLPADESARIVRTLAEAMHYAHQHGIVHRDLKPVNILLVRGGIGPISPIGPIPPLTTHQPKIADFGLAKWLGDAATSANYRTESGGIVGTASYMAPEQAGGPSQEVGPAADVYALGAILYECLTGRPPFLAESPLETLLQVKHQEPVSPRRLNAKVPRDLDTICLKCLQKEPARRYASAQELADDLRRFLDGESIRARPVGLWGRGAKWAKRRPTLAILLGLLALVPVGLAVGIMRINDQRRRAEETLHDSLEAMGAIVTPILQDDAPRDPRTERAERSLLEQALRLYEAFGQRHAGNRLLRQQTAEAYRATGRIHEHLGKPAAAQEAYGRAVAVARELVREYPGAVEHRRELAANYHRLAAALLATGRLAEAANALREAELLRQELTKEFPEEPKYRHDLAQLWLTRGSFLSAQGQVERAEATYRQAVALAEPLAHEFAHVHAYRQTWANGLDALGLLLTRLDDFEEARRIHEQALDLGRQLLADSPRNAHHRAAVAARWNHLGALFAEARRSQEAQQFHERALELSRGLVEEFPTVPGYRLAVARQLNNLAVVVRTLGDRALAQSHSQEALDLCRPLVAEHHDVLGYRSQLGTILCELGKAARDRGELGESRRLLEEAVSQQLAALKGSPGLRTSLLHLRNAYAELAETLLHLREHEQAVRVALRLPEVLPNEWEGYGRAADRLARGGLLARGDARLSRPEAEALAQARTERAFELLDRAVALKPDHPGPWAERALHHARLGRWAEAEADYARAVKLAPDDLELLASYAPVLLLTGQTDAYRALCRRIDPGFRKRHPRNIYLIARIRTLADRPALDRVRDTYMAASAVRKEPTLGWYLHGLGMAHYRAGEFEEAVRRLRESNAATWEPDGQACNWAGLALAHHRLGQAAEARRWLDRLTKWMDAAAKDTPRGAQGLLPIHPHNWFACLVLRREAEALLEPAGK